MKDPGKPGVPRVYVGGLTLPPRGFANIAVEAGVHRYGETGASS